MLKIIERSKIWFSISIIIILIGFVFMVKNGLNFGIDFNGGTLVVIDMKKALSPQDIEDVNSIVKKYNSDATVNTIETTQIEIKGTDLDTEKVNSLFSELKEKYTLDDKGLISQDLISGAIGQELSQKALIALGIAIIAMLIYVGIRFEFYFGAAAIIALLHDVLTTLSVYAIFQIPINSPFIAAMLTIVGYSINDTIVIFDRIRENNRSMKKRDIKEIANISVTQTMTRSINTVLTTLITICAVYYFVPSVRDFAFPIIIGIISGAYSSIFIASPLWVIFKNKAGKNIKNRKPATR